MPSRGRCTLELSGEAEVQFSRFSSVLPSFKAGVFPQAPRPSWSPCIGSVPSFHLWLRSSSVVMWAADQPSIQHPFLCFVAVGELTTAFPDQTPSQKVVDSLASPLGSRGLVVQLWQGLCWMAWARCSFQASCFGSASKQALPGQLQPLAKLRWLLNRLMSLPSSPPSPRRSFHQPCALQEENRAVRRWGGRVSCVSSCLCLPERWHLLELIPLPAVEAVSRAWTGQSK